MDKAKRWLVPLVLLAGFVETWIPRRDAWWLAQVVLVHQADQACEAVRHGWDRASPALEVRMTHGDPSTAQQIRTFRGDAGFVWHFYRGDVLVGTWSLKPVSARNDGWWYSEGTLSLVRIRLRDNPSLSAPLQVYDLGATYPNVRYIILVHPEHGVVGCMVGVWKT